MAKEHKTSILTLRLRLFYGKTYTAVQAAEAGKGDSKNVPEEEVTQRRGHDHKMSG